MVWNGCDGFVRVRALRVAGTPRASLHHPPTRLLDNSDELADITLRSLLQRGLASAFRGTAARPALPPASQPSGVRYRRHGAPFRNRSKSAASAGFGHNTTLARFTGKRYQLDRAPANATIGTDAEGRVSTRDSEGIQADSLLHGASRLRYAHPKQCGVLKATRLRAAPPLATLKKCPESNR